MRKGTIIVPLIVLAATLVAAQTLTPLTLNVNRELKIIVSYPIEVKYSSRVRMIFDVTSTANVTIQELRVRITLVHENGAAILFDAPIVKDKHMPPGYQVQQPIEFQASIPTPRPPADPFLEMIILVNYMVDGEPRFYEYKASISIVTRLTYSELTAALAEAQQKAQQADKLAQQVRELELKLANATGVCAVLNDQVKRLMSENNALKLQLGALQAANASLSARVTQLTAENAALRNELLALREEKGGLSSKLVNVESSYNALVNEASRLKRENEQLTAEVSNLKLALAVTIVIAAALAVLAASRFRARGRLNPLPPPPPPPPPPNRTAQSIELID